MNKNVQISAEKSFPKRRYAAFAVADFSYSILYFWVASFLTIFYQDVFGVSAGAIAFMMLIVRVFDAVNDPIIGGIMDRGKGKFGRYRPYIVIGGIGMCVCTIFLFWAHPDWGEGAKLVYMYVTYVLTTIFQTIFFMAYSALGGTISADNGVRARANSFRFTCQSAGNLAVGYIVPAILAAFSTVSLIKGYVVGVIICALIALPFIFITGIGTKEVIYPPKEEKVSLLKSMKATFTNIPMVIILVAFIINGAYFTIKMTSATYYFTYVTGNIGYFSTFSVLQSVIAIIGALTAPIVYKLVGDKAKGLGIILTITGVLVIIMKFFPAPNPVFWVLTALTGYSNGAISSFLYTMIPDAVDYTQYKDNIRIDGFMAAAASFTFKLGMAIAGSIVVLMINATGYDKTLAVQSDATIAGLNNLLTLWSGIFLLVLAALMFIYPLNEKKHNEYAAVLKERNLI